MAASGQLFSAFDDEYRENEALEEELELLQAIYITELSIIRTLDGRPRSLELLLHPATGDNADEQYVCLTLEADLSPLYPDQIPSLVIRNPRGLAEEHVAALRRELTALAGERRGQAMLYDLIELCKELLTRCNRPYGQCVVCLEDFTADEAAFSRTHCYHYFHSQCLLRYIKHEEEEARSEMDKRQRERGVAGGDKPRQVVCPVCREQLTYDLAALASHGAPSDGDDVIEIASSVRHVQRQMAALYERQLEKGGIIDVEQEANKHLIAEGEALPLPASQTTAPDEEAAKSAPDDSNNENTPARDEPLSRENSIEKGRPGSKPRAEKQSKYAPRGANHSQSVHSKSQHRDEKDDKSQKRDGKPHYRGNPRSRRGNPRFREEKSQPRADTSQCSEEKSQYKETKQQCKEDTSQCREYPRSSTENSHSREDRSQVSEEKLQFKEKTSNGACPDSQSSRPVSNRARDAMTTQRNIDNAILTSLRDVDDHLSRGQSTVNRYEDGLCNGRQRGQERYQNQRSDSYGVERDRREEDPQRPCAERGYSGQHATDNNDDNVHSYHSADGRARGYRSRQFGGENDANSISVGGGRARGFKSRQFRGHESNINSSNADRGEYKYGGSQNEPSAYASQDVRTWDRDAIYNEFDSEKGASPGMAHSRGRGRGRGRACPRAIAGRGGPRNAYQRGHGHREVLTGSQRPPPDFSHDSR